MKESIVSLYKDYFQKSKIFLYPALEIKKGASIIPIQTHVSWEEGGYKAKDKRLLCLYHIRDDKEFMDFERTRLKGNRIFEKLIKAEGEPPKGVYIFNFDRYDKDWNYFLQGRYSKISPELKRKIRECFRPTRQMPSSNNYVYIESFLHPEKFYSIYSELLGVSMDTLKSVGELASPPDLEKEALRIAVKDIKTIIK